MAVLQDTVINGKLEINGSGKLNDQNIATNDYIRDYFKRYFGKITPPISAWLYNGSVGGGDITLSSNWENCDMLMIVLTHDNSTCAGVDFVPTWQIKYARDYQQSVNADGFLFASQGSVYWYINRSSTGTKLVVRAENAVIKQIVGINFE